MDQHHFDMPNAGYDYAPASGIWELSPCINPINTAAGIWRGICGGDEDEMVYRTGKRMIGVR
jgi:hypothetical protein